MFTGRRYTRRNKEELKVQLALLKAETPPSRNKEELKEFYFFATEKS